MSLITEHIQPMLDIKRITAALVAALLFATGACAQDCALKQAGSIPMRIDSSGRVRLPIPIAGQDRDFVLNLGASHTVVSGKLAAALQMHMEDLPKPGNEIAMGGTVITQIATLPDIQLGVVKGKDVPVLAFPASASLGSDGFLGLDLLSNFDVELDFKSGKLNLFSQDHCPGKVVYWANAFGVVPFDNDSVGSVVLDMTLDGKAVRGALDTTAAHTNMFLVTAQNLFGFAPQSPDLKKVQVIGSGDIYSYPFKSLSLGNVAIEAPRIELIDADPGPICDGRIHLTSASLSEPRAQRRCYGGSDVRLGTEELRQLHLYIAFKERKAYVTVADAHK